MDVLSGVGLVLIACAHTKERTEQRGYSDSAVLAAAPSGSGWRMPP